MRFLLLAPILLGAASVGSAAVPEGFTMSRTGSVGDFAYFRGGWQTEQHKLAGKVGDPNAKWEDFPGQLCMQTYLEGAATVDELYFPTRHSSGLTLRTFDGQKQQWSIYWVSSTTGRLDPVPVVGGFQNNRGEFYAFDHVNGVPVKVRYLWIIKDHDHARWEQALSFDDHTWQTNWTADFTRAAEKEVCPDGHPAR